MSEVKLNKKEKFTKGRNEERNNKFKGNGERRTFKKDGGGGDDDKRGNGEGRSFDLKRKRVYGERGVEKEGENSNGRVPKWKSLPRKDGFRKKSGVNDDVSDFDRLNRLKFSSGKGGNVRKGEFNEEKGRKKDGESWRGYKGKTGVKVEGKRFSGRVGKEEGVASNLRSRTETRDRWVSSKRSEEVGFDGKPNFEGKCYSGRGKERVGSGEGSESKFKSKVETRDRWISTKRREDEVSDSKLKSRPKTNDRRVIVKQDDVPDGLQKTYSRKKIDSNRQADQKPSNRHGVEPPGNSMKKMLRSKKDAVKNSEWEDGPPKKKKKKVMRIDPQDISNKRLDDSIPISGTTVEKEVDPDKENEISKNAQFRAIQPSPSILSFVEDNLLGRRRSIELRRAGYNIDLSAPLDNIPLSTSSERERIEEAVFRNKLEFFAAAKISSSFPPAELPEIAFAGRSNVGKSSLLNALTRQWGVVRTSDKPGLTQTINFFKLGPKLSMVDLPGYGFAYAKEEVKDAWEELVKEYVSTRVGLKRVCLLIDTKWGMKPRDHELINLMERSQTKYQIVLTKSDLVFPIDVARRAMQIEETLKANKSLVQPVMMASAKSGAGIQSLRTALAKIARFTKL